MTVLLLIALAATVCTVVLALGKVAAWVPLMIICIYLLLQSLPLGK